MAIAPRIELLPKEIPDDGLIPLVKLPGLTAERAREVLTSPKVVEAVAGVVAAVVDKVTDGVTPAATWRLGSWKKPKGTLWAVESGKDDDRQRIYLGYGERSDFEPVLEGMTALEVYRAWAEKFKLLAPDPTSLDEGLVPLTHADGREGHGGTGPLLLVRTRSGPRVQFPSPQHLARILEAARTSEEKDHARETVLTYLIRTGEARRMARATEETRSRDGRRAASTHLEGTTIRALVQGAGLRLDLGQLPLREYIDSVWAPLRKAASPKEWPREESRLRLHVVPHLGHRAVQDLDVRDLFACCKEGTRADGEPLDYNGQRLIKCAVSVMMKYAYEKKHIQHPISFDGLVLRGAPRSAPKQRALSRTEALALMAAGETVAHRALLTVALELGPRPAEMVRLRWEDVSWKTTARNPYGTLHVAGEKTGESDRTVPLSPLSAEALRVHWVKAGSPTTGTIFLAKGGQEYVVGQGADYYADLLLSAARRVGIKGRVTPYTLRHTAGTLLLRAGMPPDSVRALLGHTAVSRTLELAYDHRTANDRIAGKAFADLVWAEDEDET